MNPSGLTIQAFQQHISDRYESTDRARGTDATFVYLIEEVGELARALKRKERDPANLEEEFADVVAWLCTLANINEVNLADAISRKYLGENRPVGEK